MRILVKDKDAIQECDLLIIPVFENESKGALHYLVKYGYRRIAHIEKNIAARQFTGELHEQYEVPYTWGDITYSPPGMKGDELKKLQRKCVFNFYFPGRIHLIVGNIRRSNILQFLRRLLLLFKNKR